MPRNLNRRVEVVFPVRDPKLIRHLRDDVLATYLADTVKARRMQPNGSYFRSTTRAAQQTLNSQQSLIERAVSHRFQPLDTTFSVLFESRSRASANFPGYCSLAYSAFASFRIGVSGSASFHSVTKSL